MASLGLALATALPLAVPARIEASPATGASAPASPAVRTAPPLKEARALDLLRATSRTLAASRSLAFTATVGYEYPSRLGPPLLYTVRYDVLMQRPDKLRVLIPGDGPASQFFFDGTTITAFSPGPNLVATRRAPGTLESALELAFRQADIYFPFTDLLVADPYRAMTEGVFHAFSIGSSALIDGQMTDMVAIASKDVFLQLWIARSDKLPRRIRAIYAADPLRLRHQMDLGAWRLNPEVPAAAFTSAAARRARPIPFQRPSPGAPPAARPLRR